MTHKEKFEALIRKEVRELLKRHVFFSRELVSLACENYELKRKLIDLGLKLKKLQAQLQELTKRKELKKKSES